MGRCSGCFGDAATGFWALASTGKLPLASPIPYHRPPSPAWFLKLFVNWPLQIQIEKWKREEPAKMVQSFHGNPQIASLRGCKVTLLAFVWCMMHGVSKDQRPNSIGMWWCQVLGLDSVDWGLVDLSPLCLLTCLLKLPAREDSKLHWLHLFDQMHDQRPNSIGMRWWPGFGLGLGWVGDSVGWGLGDRADHHSLLVAASPTQPVRTTTNINHNHIGSKQQLTSARPRWIKHQFVHKEVSIELKNQSLKMYWNKNFRPRAIQQWGQGAIFLFDLGWVWPDAQSGSQTTWCSAEEKWWLR